MKTLLSIGMMLCLLLTGISCSSTQNFQDNAKITALTDGGNFTFMAQRANPMNMDVINILNSFPASNYTRVLELDPGSTINVSAEKITVDLPYFGRMFIASMDPTKNGFDFTSKSFTIDKSKSTAKKQVWIINLNDVQNVQQIFLEILPSGKTTASFNSRDRQAISYDGYITDSETTSDSGK